MHDKIVQKLRRMFSQSTALLVLWLSGNFSVPAVDTHLAPSPSPAPNAQPIFSRSAPNATPSRAATDPLAAAIGAKLGQFMPGAAVPPAAGLVQAQAKKDAAQQEAIRLLRERAGQAVEVYLRPGEQTVIQVRGAVLERPAHGFALPLAGGLERQTARNFLRANRDLL